MVLLVSLELKAAVEFLEEETVGNPFRRQLSSFESLNCSEVASSFKCTGVESSSRIAVESLSWRGSRIRRGRSAELLWEAMQVEPL